MTIKHYLLLGMFFLLLSACTQVENEKKQTFSQEQAQQIRNISHEQEHAMDIDNPVEEDSTDVKEEENDVLKPLYRIDPVSYYVKPVADAPKKVVLLTIDDAPDQYALEMATILQELQVNAIFFVNGHFLATDEQKDILRQIHDMGFVIGNHTMTHANLKMLSEEEQYQEIVGLNDLVEEIIGERPKFFRAPHGVNTDYSRQVVAQEKMVLMNWSYGYDFKKDYMSKEALVDIMVNSEYLRNGANLLMHDRQWTKEALKEIVIGLQNKGYTIIDPKSLETLT